MDPPRLLSNETMLLDCELYPLALLILDSHLTDLSALLPSYNDKKNQPYLSSSNCSSLGRTATGEDFGKYGDPRRALLYHVVPR